MGASITLKSESPSTIAYRPFLVELVVTVHTDRAATFTSNVSPAVVGLSLWSCRAVNFFCRVTSGFVFVSLRLILSNYDARKDMLYGSCSTFLDSAKGGHGLNFREQI